VQRRRGCLEHLPRQIEPRGAAQPLRSVRRLWRSGSRPDRAGQYSIRVNDQLRICFRWSNAGPTDVEIVDYH
jgi:proteic killer suppression protein